MTDRLVNEYHFNNLGKICQGNYLRSIAGRRVILSAWRLNGIIDNARYSSGDHCDQFAKKDNQFTLAIICMLAASVGLTMAIINLSKLLLVICGVATWPFNQREPKAVAPQPERLS